MHNNEGPSEQAKSYGPVEICQMFGVTKSTLFRWEREGVLPSGKPFPVPQRDRQGERLYTPEHVRAIAEYRKEQLARQYERVAETDLQQAEKTLQELSLLKIQYLSDTTGFFEILARRKLPVPKVLRLLSEIAERSPAVNSDNGDLWNLLHKLAVKLVRVP